MEVYKTETIIGTTPKEIDRKHNQFGKEHIIRATQVNTVKDLETGEITYIHTLFYE